MVAVGFLPQLKFVFSLFLPTEGRHMGYYNPWFSSHVLKCQFTSETQNSNKPENQKMKYLENLIKFVLDIFI
jgi:hypothetical protein